MLCTLYSVLYIAVKCYCLLCSKQRLISIKHKIQFNGKICYGSANIREQLQSVGHCLNCLETHSYKTPKSSLRPLLAPLRTLSNWCCISICVHSFIHSFIHSLFELSGCFVVDNNWFILLFQAYVWITWCLSTQSALRGDAVYWCYSFNSQIMCD